MSGSAPTNSQAVQFEQQQAWEAQNKEAERQQRLKEGQAAIDAIFGGQPVMGTRTANYDWSTFQPPGTQGAGNAPSGYTAVQVPRPGGGAAADPYAASYGTATGGFTGGRGANEGYITPGPGGGAGGGQTWALRDASGKIYRPGDPLSYQQSYDTGQKTGGFDDAFYNAYKQKYLDYYQPDEQRQYDVAKRTALYNAARAGTVDSSAFGDVQGNLAYNDALARAQIASNANTATGQLRDQIQGNKQALINQLYATEDPTLTANLAESSAAASRLQNPMLTPAASFFSPAISALGSAAQYFSPYGPAGAPAAGGSATPQPTVASASAGSGKVYGA